MEKEVKKARDDLENIKEELKKKEIKLKESQALSQDLKARN